MEALSQLQQGSVFPADHWPCWSQEHPKAQLLHWVCGALQAGGCVSPPVLRHFCAVCPQHMESMLPASLLSSCPFWPGAPPSAALPGTAHPSRALLKELVGVLLLIPFPSSAH